MKLFLQKISQICLLFYVLPCISQTPFNPNIKVIYDAPYVLEFSITQLGGLRKSYYAFKGNSPTERGVVNIFPECPRKGFYSINDGISGHKIFVTEADTATITLTRMKDIEEKKKRGEPVFKVLELNVRSKHPGNYTFFDDLEKITGTTNKWRSGDNESAAAFKIRMEAKFQTSINLLNSYADKKIVSEDFVPYAKAEIEASYITLLCTCLWAIPRSKLPVDFFDRANTLKFDSEEFAETVPNYLQAANFYVYYILNEFNTKDETAGFIDKYDAILTYYSGDIRNQLLSLLLIAYANKDKPEYESIYADAITKINNDYIKENTERKVEQKKKATLASKKKVEVKFEEVLSKTQMFDIKGNTILFRNLLSDSIPTIVDCWATWCFPCREQIPAMETFEKGYAGKVNVLYLSFDQDKAKWNSFIIDNKKQTKNQFLIDSTFTSPFSNYFDIGAIPRYILIAPKGEKVLNDKMPLPGLKDDFETELKKYL